MDAAVSLIDRSASAELLFVATSRSKRELDIIVPRSAFENLDDLAAHISARISLKTTTQTFDEILERTGGKETIRVRNMEAQREALPLRRVYDADVLEPLRALQQQRVGEARESYQECKREIVECGLPMEDRLGAGREALRAMRSAVLAAYRELRPQPFGKWLQEREERRERGRSSVDRGGDREQTLYRGPQELLISDEFSEAGNILRNHGLHRER